MRYLVVFLALAAPLVGAAPIYKCKDDSGKINFTDHPCDGVAREESSSTSLRRFPFIEAAYQADVGNMLDRLAREHPACKERLDPMTAAKSTTQGTAENPSFFVQCGDERVPQVVRFTLQEAQAREIPAVKQPISERDAIRACRSAARKQALKPDSVDFSVIMDANFVVRQNGNSTFSTAFTALNGFGVESKYLINCSFEGEFLSGVSIKPF